MYRKDRPDPKDCTHPDKSIITLKKYRKNYPFGKKSRYRTYEPPIKETEMCTRCLKKLWKRKPESEL